MQKIKNILRRINIFSRLKEWQKILLVIILGLILTGSGFLGVRYFTDTAFRENVSSVFTGQNSNTKAKNEYVQGQVARINDVLSKINFDKNYYNDYTFADLDIYPLGFQRRFFNENERRNQSISGANADPDNDGLINKLEFFYGSNPKEKKSLCANTPTGQKPLETSTFVCDDRNDNDLVKAFISPLTGLDLDTSDRFRVLNQDINVINNIRNTFDQASNDGVDLPTLYQESLLVNLESEADKFKVTEIDDNAKNVLEYRAFRVEIVEVLVGSEEVSPLSQVYTATSVQQLESLETQYNNILKKIESSPAPKMYSKTHKLYQMLFSKLSELAKHRKLGIQNNTFETEEYKATSKKIAIETTWVYRRLKEEGAKNQNKFN
jgi:hypothetical protein